jgi:CBS domain containing-hemolysin-like protein
VGTLLSDLGTAAFLVGAEALAAFSVWCQVALERHSRARLLELAVPLGRRARVEALLKDLGAYELSVRLTRFLGKALLVLGVAYVALRERLGEVRRAGLVLPGDLPWGVLVLIVAVTFLLNFVVNDLLVGFLARGRPNRFLVRALPALDVIRIATAPFRLPLSLLVRALFRVRLEEGSRSAREEVLDLVEEGEREGSFATAEADMIGAIMDLPTETAGDILIPRADVSMIRADATLAEAVAFVNEDGHSRVPAYGADRDDVLGVLYARDLLGFWGKPEVARLKVRDVMRPVYFVPASKTLPDLLVEMRTRKVHIAVVLNEFRGTAGIITVEDLLERIVGDIEDEYDEPLAARAAFADGSVSRDSMDVEGRALLEDVNRAIGVSLPLDEDFETVGGLVFHRLGRVPKVGDRLRVEDVDFTVMDADDRTVKRVRLEVRGPADPPRKA